MFWEKSTGSERLSAWRNFRRSFPVTGTPSDVAEYFSTIKPMPRYIDYYTPASWPNVFDIMHEGYFCQSGITLLICATLRYLDFIKSDKLSVPVISNNITGAEGLVLDLNGEFYNFLPGKIVSQDFVKNNGVVYDTHIITVDKLFD